MRNLDYSLFQLAQKAVQAGREKSAVVPAGGGAPPMDPAMMGGGAPPMDPAMMGGGAPPMDPAMMGGGAPPMDPAMMGGGAPPMDPAMMGGGAPVAGAMPGSPAATQKLKPEQMMQMLDFRLYNMQQQITAIMNAMNLQLPPGALVTPPGSPIPVAEAALPGGPQDPTQTAGAEGGGGGSAISPIAPLAGASPEQAAAGAKMAESKWVEKLAWAPHVDTQILRRQQNVAHMASTIRRLLSEHKDYQREAAHS